MGTSDTVSVPAANVSPATSVWVWGAEAVEHPVEDAHVSSAGQDFDYAKLWQHFSAAGDAVVAIGARGLAFSSTCGQYFGVGGTGGWSGSACTCGCGCCSGCSCSGSFSLSCTAGYAGNCFSGSCSRSRSFSGCACFGSCSGYSTSWNDNGCVCSACGAGYYCTGGTAGRIDCPAGSFGSSSTLTSSTCNGLCSAGYWCTSASTSATQNLCPAGTYCPAGATGTTLCPGGRYGATSAMGSSSCTGGCQAGYYCPAGSTSATQFGCPAGSFCAAGSPAPTTCTLPGYYCPSLTQSATQYPCPAGYYCPAGQSAVGPACAGTLQYCPGTTGAPITILATGQYATGCNTAGNRCTGVATCPADMTCTDGVVDLATWVSPAGAQGSVATVTGVYQPSTPAPGTIETSSRTYVATTNYRNVPISGPAFSFIQPGSTRSMQYTVTVQSVTPAGCQGTAATPTFTVIADQLYQGNVPFDDKFMDGGCTSIILLVNAVRPSTFSQSLSLRVPITLQRGPKPPALYKDGQGRCTGGPWSVNAGVGYWTPVGAPLRANGSVGNTIIYQAGASGSGSLPFAMDGCTGQLRTSLSTLPYSPYPWNLTITAFTFPSSPLLSDSCNMSVVVNNVNVAPIITMPGSVSFSENAPLGSTVATATATDAENDALTWSFTVSDDPDVLDINPSTGTITLTAPVDFNEKRIYRYTVGVKDNKGGRINPVEQDVVFNLLLGARPPVLSGLGMFTVPEFSPAGTILRGAYNITGTPHEAGAQVTLSVVDSGLFGIHQWGGLFVQPGAVLDYGLNRSYSITVQALTVSSGLTTWGRVTVNVEYVSMPPTWAEPGPPFAARSVTENTLEGLSFGAPVSCRHKDQGAVLLHSVVAVRSVPVTGAMSPPPASLGMIDADPLTGQLRAGGTPVNYERVRALNVTVNCRHASGTINATVRVDVQDANDSPVLAGGVPFNVSEAASFGTVVGSVASRRTDEDVGDIAASWAITNQEAVPNLHPATDPFSIDGTGTLRLAVYPGDLDYRVKRTYALTVQVTDAGGATASAPVTVNLLHSNRGPYWLAVPPMYARSGVSGQEVGRPLSDYARDPDIGLAGIAERLTYSIVGGNASSMCSVDANTGQLSVLNGAPIVFPGPAWAVIVRATDAGINGAVRTNDTTVILLPSDYNQPPVVFAMTLTIPENSAPGTELGPRRINATDTDQLQTVSYDLSPTGASIYRHFPFTITRVAGGLNNVGLGRVAIMSPPPLGLTLPWGVVNFEEASNYTAIVTVTDSHPTTPLTARAAITILVLDMPEPPYFNPNRTANSSFFTLALDENSPPGTNLTLDPAASTDAANVYGGLPAADEDAADKGLGALTYGWAPGTPSSVSSLFAIHPATGVVSLTPAGAATVNFEARSRYSLIASVRDRAGAVDYAAVTVLVRDVNEAAAFQGLRSSAGTPIAGWSFAVNENLPTGTLIATVNATDPDVLNAAFGAVQYSLLSNSESALFSIHPQSGALTLAAPPDWEDKALWQPTVLVQDARADGTAPILVSRQLSIAVNDLNDAAVTGIRVHPADKGPSTGVSSEDGAAWQPYADSLPGAGSSVTALFSTEGRVRVILSGTGLGLTSRRLRDEGRGSSPTSVSASYSIGMGASYSATACSITANGTEVTCTASAGFGLNHVWSLTLSTGLAGAVPHTPASSVRSGYLPPSLRAVTVEGVAPADAMDRALNAIPTAAGVRVWLNGSNLGAFSAPVSVTYGPTGSEYTATTCRAIVPHRTLSCEAARGIGGALSWTVSVGDASPSTILAPFNGSAVAYRPPTVTSVSAAPLDTQGGGAVVLTGSNLGPAGTTGASLISARYSNSWGLPDELIYPATGCIVTASDTQITCAATAGVGVGHTWELTVGGQVALSSGTTSYAAPNITGLDTPPADASFTWGGQEVRINGVNLGPAGTALPVFARYGHAEPGVTPPSNLTYEALSCTVTAAHRQISCTTAEGTGAGLLWSVQVGGQWSALDPRHTSSYSRPVVATYTSPSWDPYSTSRADTQGGQLVYVEGRNFGPVGAHIDRVSYGAGGAEDFEALACTVSQPHVQLACYTAAGAGSGLTWRVVIDGQNSTTPSTSYGAPVIDSIEGEGARNGTTDGGQEVFLHGSFFGEERWLEGVTYGPTGSEYHARNCSVWLDHAVIRCLTSPGTGRVLYWQVTVRGQRSRLSAVSTSYAPPEIWDVSPGTAGTEGGLRVRLTGTDLARLYSSAVVTVHLNAYALPAPQQLPDCIAHWRLEDGARALNSTELEPCKHWLASLETPAVGPTMANGTAPGAHALEFDLPAGFGSSTELLVTVDGVPSRLLTWRYGAPEIMNLAPDRFNVTVGKLRLFVDGRNFCEGHHSCGRLLVDGRPVRTESWSHGQVLAVVDDPKVLGLNESLVSVEVNGVASNSRGFSTPVPSFNALRGATGWTGMDSRGGELFFVEGVTSVATVPSSSLLITIGGRPCTDVNKSSFVDTYADYGIPPTAAEDLRMQYRAYRIECRTPAGVGAGLYITIGVLNGAQSRNDNSFTFSYAPPSITEVALGTDPRGALLGTSRALPSLTALDPATGLQRVGVPTTGGNVTVYGAGFGEPGLVPAGSRLDLAVTLTYPGRAGVAGLVRGRVLFHNHTVLVLEVAPNQGRDVRLQVTAGEQSNPGTVTIRHRPPTVSSVSPQGLSTIGGASLGQLGVITVEGSDFGAAKATDSVSGGRPVVTIGGRECELANGARRAPFADPLDHTTLYCVLPEYWGADLPVVVSVAGLNSSVTTLSRYSYAPPRLIAVTPPTAPTSGLHPATGEPLNITITGSDLGREGDVELEVEVDAALAAGTGIADATGGLPAGRVLTVPHSAMLVHNHSHMVFRAPVGAGSRLRVWAVIGGQRSAEALYFGYEAAWIVGWDRPDREPAECRPRIRPLPLGYNGSLVNRTIYGDCYPTAGQFMLRIKGHSFSSDPDVPVSITVGGRDCFAPSVSHDVITCMAPRGMGDRNDIAVKVGGRRNAWTQAAIFAYDPPAVVSIMPNTPDANGQGIQLRGYNFGPTANPVLISVGGIPCTDAEYMSDSMVKCSTPHDTVGPKNLTVLAANRSEPFVWYASEEMVITVCKKGFTGLLGEECLDCSSDVRGAECPGEELYFDLAVSKFGWWRTNMTAEEDRKLCHVKRRAREVGCPVYLPCEPAGSCLGANFCAEGYTADRCSECLKGSYYRVNGECIKCPDSPWAVVIAFALGGTFALACAYYMNKRNVSLALISIGIDYFQILAMFSRTRIRWPAVVKQIFLIMSAFNFNLEIVAPECAIPTVKYSGKWLFIEGLPLFAWALLGTFGVLRFLWKWAFLSTRKRWGHLPVLISTGIVVLRVLYIYITRTTLDVFNCSPTNPPDGNEYMAWQLDIICYQPGGAHLFLLPFAVAALLLYVIGAPLGALWLLYRNKEAVKYDLILRAQGLGDDRLTNPRYYTFRKTWSKLYYHFMPGKWYWEFIITAKKFLIAFCSLMFRSTPSYQLAVALLVLFAAYVLHVKHTPYMTHKQALSVVADHQAKCLTSELHMRIASDMKAAFASSGKAGKARSAGMEGLKRGKDTGFAANLQAARTVAGQHRLLALCDYNAVEGVLLSSAILVNLAGIMFDSARFSGDLAQFYANEYDSLAFSTIALIFLSVIYLLSAVFLDLFLVCAPRSAEACLASVSARAQQTKSKLAASKAGKKLGAALRVSFGSGESSGSTSGIVMASNPMAAHVMVSKAAGRNQAAAMVAGMVAPPSQEEWQHIRTSFLALSERVNTLSKENESLRTGEGLIVDSGSPLAQGRKVRAYEAFKPRLAFSGLDARPETPTPGTPAVEGGAPAGVRRGHSPSPAPGSGIGSARSSALSLRAIARSSGPRRPQSFRAGAGALGASASGDSDSFGGSNPLGRPRTRAASRSQQQEEPQQEQQQPSQAVADPASMSAAEAYAAYADAAARYSAAAAQFADRTDEEGQQLYAQYADAAAQYAAAAHAYASQLGAGTPSSPGEQSEGAEAEAPIDTPNPLHAAAAGE